MDVCQNFKTFGSKCCDCVKARTTPTLYRNLSNLFSMLSLCQLLLGPCYIYLWYQVAQQGNNYYLQQYDNSWPKNSKDYVFVTSLALALVFQFSSVCITQVFHGCKRKRLMTLISIVFQFLAAVFLLTGMAIWSHFRQDFQQDSDIFVRAFYLKKPGYLYNMGWTSFVMMLLGAFCSLKSSAFHDQITRVFDTRPGTGATGVTETGVAETSGPANKHRLPNHNSLRPNSGDVSRPNSGFTRSVSSMSRPKTAKSIFFDMASVLTEEDVGSDFSQ